MQHAKVYKAFLGVLIGGGLALAISVGVAAADTSKEKSCYNPNEGFDTVFVDCSTKENAKCEALQDLRAHGKSSYACYCQNVVENKTYTAECPSYIQSTVIKMVKNSKMVDAKSNRMPASVPDAGAETTTTEK